MPKKGTVWSPVTIQGMNEKGEAWGTNIEGTPVFFDLRRAAPGDTVTARVIGKRQGRLQGIIESIDAESPFRRSARCEHFGVCGGCSLQHISYSTQLQMKNDVVQGLLLPFVEKDRSLVFEPIGAPSEFYFRNKMEYTASARPWLRPEDMHRPSVSSGSLGLFVPFSSNKVLDIATCHIQDEIGNRVRNWCREYASLEGLSYYSSNTKTGFLRTLLVRSTRHGQSLVTFVVGEDNPEVLSKLCESFLKDFPSVNSVWYVVNTKLNDSYADLNPVHVSGSRTIEERLDGLRFSIGPQTFFQVNSDQTEIMYKRIVETAKISPDDIVWDLYCGVGTISSYAARSCKKVIGIEYVEAAIRYARETCEINGIFNTEFFSGDMKDMLNDDFVALHGVPDIVITDPPRSGMHPAACKVLAESGAGRIMYVSCKPESLARDLSILSENYRLESVQTVDLMPQSSHIETLAYLEHR